MISSIMCWFNIHAGKWAAPYSHKSWTTSPDGVVKVSHFKKQERFCNECNTWEIREVKMGEEVWQPWSANYKEKVAELNK